MFLVSLSNLFSKPKTILSGLKKSFIANHSLKNSGFETILFFPSNNCETFLFVQTGTVDFITIISLQLR